MLIMMSTLQKYKIPSCIIFLFVLLSALFYSPHSSRASQLIYTIQTGSFQDEADARKQYDYVLRSLSGQEAEYLRIEIVDRFYTVRIGKFESYSDTEKRYRTVKSLLSEAMIMKAYIIDDRLVELHGGFSTVDAGEEEKDVPQATETNRPGTDEKADAREMPLSDKEVVASIASLVKEKEYNAALYIVNTEIELRPENPVLNAWMGTVLLKKDLPLEALKYLKKAVKLSPDVADYHNVLGYSWFFLKKYDEALDEFERAVGLEPGHLDALSGLCLVYSETGEKEKALEMYDKMKILDKETADKLIKVIGPPS
jgi:tetratricopeptide (TPR) repeat protein